MNECGKPAKYIGTLTVSPDDGRVLRAPVVKGAFCEDCTKTPSGRFRQFVSERPADSWDRCKVGSYLTDI